MMNWKRMWKVMAYFKILSWHSPGTKKKEKSEILEWR
jgi:hypothetical protein